jgi:hypothetical protein
MKILYLLIPAAAIAIGAGCQSGGTRTISRTTTTTQTVQTTAPQQNAPPAVVQQEPKPGIVQQFTTDKATYTVETIPNTRLTPTSREGDNADRVFSSNIIAIYVHTNNGATMNSTNATAIPTPADNPPEAK